MIHDVITTDDSFPDTAKSMFVGVRKNKTQQVRRWKIYRIRTKWCRIPKISNLVGRNDNFIAKAWKSSILPTSLDIFDLQQHYMRILYISFSTLTIQKSYHGHPIQLKLRESLYVRCPVYLAPTQRSDQSGHLKLSDNPWKRDGHNLGPIILQEPIRQLVLELRITSGKRMAGKQGFLHLTVWIRFFLI